MTHKQNPWEILQMEGPGDLSHLEQMSEDALWGSLFAACDGSFKIKSVMMKVVALVIAENTESDVLMEAMKSYVEVYRLRLEALNDR